MDMLRKNPYAVAGKHRFVRNVSVCITTKLFSENVLLKKIVYSQAYRHSFFFMNHFLLAIQCYLCPYCFVCVCSVNISVNGLPFRPWVED